MERTYLFLIAAQSALLYDFFSILASAREKGNYSLSEACEILISKNNLGGVNIGDSFWIDIDTPEALEYCRLNGQMLRPV